MSFGRFLSQAVGSTNETFRILEFKWVRVVRPVFSYLVVSVLTCEVS